MTASNASNRASNTRSAAPSAPPPLLLRGATDVNNNSIIISIPCSSATAICDGVCAVDAAHTPSSTSKTPTLGEETQPPSRSFVAAPTAVAESSAVNDDAPHATIVPSNALASSFTARLGERLSAVADRISAKLLLPGRNSSSALSSASSSGGGGSGGDARKCFVETLYPDQCVEKVSLIPIFVDDGERGGAGGAFLTSADDQSRGGGDERQCRICLLSSPASSSSSSGTADGAPPPKTKRRRKLIAPCRCAGTVQYVHISCLTHWIEVSSRKMYSIPKCELCGYKFRRKPFIDLTRIHFPYVDWCDRILNMLFLFLVAIMVLCGWVAIHYLCLAERRPLIRPSRHTNSKRFLTDNDVTVIIASILFFAAFFIALFTQYRAEVNVFRILTRMWATNRNWRIRDYDARFDDERAGGGELERNADNAATATANAVDAIGGVEFVEEDDGG